MKKVGFRYLDHTADVQVESWAPSLEEAFAQTALSLMATISPNLKLTLTLKQKNTSFLCKHTSSFLA